MSSQAASDPCDAGMCETCLDAAERAEKAGNEAEARAAAAAEQVADDEVADQMDEDTPIGDEVNVWRCSHCPVCRSEVSMVLNRGQARKPPLYAR